MDGSIFQSASLDDIANRYMNMRRTISKIKRLSRELEEFQPPNAPAESYTIDELYWFADDLANCYHMYDEIEYQDFKKLVRRVYDFTMCRIG